MDIKSKARRQRIAVIRGQIEELNRAFPYIGNSDYYYSRLKTLNNELGRVRAEIYRNDGIPLDTDEKIEQFIVTYE